MKYELVLSGKFKKGLKSAKKRGLDISLLDSIVDKLLHGIPLEEKYQDHPLKGNWMAVMFLNTTMTFLPEN